MQFRYKLDKKTFKNKKVPAKRATGEENISADQRGDNEWTDSNLLSLDKDTKWKEDKPKEVKEVSRRSIFGLDRLTEYADAVDEEEKKNQPAKDVSENTPVDPSATSGHGSPATAEPEATEEKEAPPEPQKSAPKQSAFRRFTNRFRARPIFDEAPEQKEKPAEQEEKPPEPETVSEDSPSAKAPAENLKLEKEPFDPLGLNDLEEAEDPEYDRRNLLRQGVHFFAKPAMDSVQGKIDRVNETVDKITRRVPLLRPPGAISEQKFLQACTRCDECIHACPKDAIQRVPKKMGFLIMGTPYIDPKKNPCVMCDDLPCIPACPDGALKPTASKFDVKMGYAILDKTKCQAYGHTFCQQCVIDCPVPGAITQKDEKPRIHKNVCTGCGVCVLSCSTVNIPVAIKVKPQMVIESQIRKKKMEEEKARIAAEREAAKKAAEREEQVQEDKPVKVKPDDKDLDWDEIPDF
jgi:MauM/NapG family ferredoxin protein